MTYDNGVSASGEVDGGSEELPGGLQTPLELTGSPAVSGKPSADDDPVEAGLQRAVSDAVDTVVDVSLSNAANERDSAQVGSVEGLNVGEPVTVDPTGWAGVRMASLQAAAATAVADVAKTVAETGVRRAKEQAAAAAKLGSDQGSKAAVAARRRGSQLATAAQEQAARSASQLRTSGTEFVTVAASNPRVQQISRKARDVTELRARQAAGLRRRRVYILALLAAIIGIAVGLYEKRRRTAAVAQPERAVEDAPVPPLPELTDDRAPIMDDVIPTSNNLHSTEVYAEGPDAPL